MTLSIQNPTEELIIILSFLGSLTIAGVLIWIWIPDFILKMILYTYLGFSALIISTIIFSGMFVGIDKVINPRRYN